MAMRFPERSDFAGETAQALTGNTLTRFESQHGLGFRLPMLVARQAALYTGTRYAPKLAIRNALFSENEYIIAFHWINSDSEH
ncbi:MAG: hypothetical protein ACKVP3_10320 [Hyphomicrobiaceae bacterium]